ncbi:hypothetical protein M0R89_07710 [Halorussus limi]|uniref:Uncharacterized protein n=1 Tax=Halorussus limi TaxID=2938695 RepID=A0A8U0HXQ2_9EURY|nr:hypothetical protein [Halorussus limi]UPV75935.1 hypothetical protein M0R89_07710 [Halorussus limi]
MSGERPSPGGLDPDDAGLADPKPTNSDPAGFGPADSDSADSRPADSDPTTRYGEAWVYESIVGAIPGLSPSRPVAVGVQFAVFEGLVLALAAVYDLWSAVPAGTAAVGVAAAGSYLMLALGEEIRGVGTPAAYRRALFSSNVEVVLGVVSFVALLTYLFAAGARSGQVPLFASLLGETPPVAAVALALLVAWDLCYRIGTAWWASVTGLARTVRYRDRFDARARARLRRADLLTVAFALLHLPLAAFVRSQSLLVWAVVGHVAAVTLVSGASASLLRRS